MADAYIYDAVRTPRGKGRKDGALHEVTAVRLSAQVLNALKDRNGLDGHAVEEGQVAHGAVAALEGDAAVKANKPCRVLNTLDEALPLPGKISPTLALP